jgi:nicotinamidase-related amidase
MHAVSTRARWTAVVKIARAGLGGIRSVALRPKSVLAVVHVPSTNKFQAVGSRSSSSSYFPGAGSIRDPDTGHPETHEDGSMNKPELLTPDNCQLIFIDHQPQMAFGVASIDRQQLKNNVVALAKSARVFGIPTTITTVETESFSGHTYPELLAVFPEHPLLERTSMNSWDDQKVRDALAANGQKKVVVSGLWTEVCNNTFAFSAMAEGGYEIYMVADASGGTSQEAHDYAMQRMIQAGVVPVTWQQVLLEWQRDWAHRDTYDAVMDIVREHSGAYGMGVDYAYTMVHNADERVSHGERLAPVAGS